MKCFSQALQADMEEGTWCHESCKWMAYLAPTGARDIGVVYYDATLHWWWRCQIMGNRPLVNSALCCIRRILVNLSATQVSLPAEPLSSGCSECGAGLTSWLPRIAGLNGKWSRWSVCLHRLFVLRFLPTGSGHVSITDADRSCAETAR